MNNEISNTFYEVQAEKFYQKKVEVARGVIELGQILIETKKGLEHGEWYNWLNDSRVGFGREQARKYMVIAEELSEIATSGCVLDNLSMKKLFKLASAPEEVKEDVVNSNSKEEAEKKIKAYEEQLKQERLAKDALIKSNQQLQNQIEAKEKELDTERKTKKIEYRTNEVVVEPADYNSIKNKIKQLEESLKMNKIDKETSKHTINSLKEEIEKLRNADKEKEKQLKEYDQLNRKLIEIGVGVDERQEYLEDTTELAKLIGTMNYFFEEKLAPTRYKRCFKYHKQDRAVIKSLRDIIEKMEDWLMEMKQNLPETSVNNNDFEIIDVEVQ